MIETLASSSYRRRSGRAPDALKYGLQSGPRRVACRGIFTSHVDSAFCFEAKPEGEYASG